MSDNLALPCDCRIEQKNVPTAAVDQGVQGESNLAKDEMVELGSAFLPESSPASKLPLALSISKNNSTAVVQAGTPAGEDQTSQNCI